MSFAEEFERELDAAHVDFARAVRRQFVGPPPPAPTGWRRVKMGARWAVYSRLRGARQRLALKVAPWLNE